MTADDRNGPVLVIGAGPAGLTAAYLLSRRGIPVTVLEADPEYVGGLSRTIRYKGFHFDIGGHRFFSKSKVVEHLWTELLPDDLIHRPRSSQIYYRGRFFSYPLKAGEALVKLGVIESALCVASYVRAKAFPVKNPRSFEDWVSNHFGRRLYEIFFKTYTEKVWGMSCREISADWAAQRIKGLSLWTAVLNALGLEGLLGLKKSGNRIEVDPRIPANWPGFRNTYRFGLATYEFQIENPSHENKGVQQVSLNGRTLPDKVIPLSREGNIHTVLIVMG